MNAQLCSGIAYIDWDLLTAPHRTVDKNIMRCVGRYRRFSLEKLDLDNSFPPPQVKTKYVRAVGSTAILFSPPDAMGRRKAAAQTVGPLDLKGVEVGPVEESIVDLAQRLEEHGFRKVLIEPASLLMNRAFLVSQRSFEMLKSSILPIPQFMNRMQRRIPELVRDSYDIASSIRIEIKIEDFDSESNDKSK